MKHQTTILTLGAAALVSVGLAALAIQWRAEESAPSTAPMEFFPGLASKITQAARIHIVSHDSSFDVVYSADKGWVLPSRGNYPADFDEVRHTLIGLAALQTIEPKTARPDWFHYIGVETPPQGNGVLIEVDDAKGKMLASLIAGNMEDIGDPGGTAGLFARRPDENQSWLTRAVFVPHGDAGAWMLSHVMDIDAARLKDMSVTAPGRSFTLSRAHLSDQDYVLTPAAKGAPTAMLDAIPTVITGFGIADAQPVAKIDFSKPVHVTAHTFDGLSLAMDVTFAGADAWAKLSAAAAPGATPAIAEEARALDARSAGWAYKLNPDKGRLLMFDPKNPGLR